MRLALLGPPQEAAKTPEKPFLTLNVEGGTATLTGILPDDDTKSRITGQAVRVYGRANVVDRVRVESSVAREPWMKAAPSIITSAARNVQNARVEIDKDSVRVSGNVTSQKVKNKILRSVAGASRGLKVQDGLIVGNGAVMAAAPVKAPAGTVKALDQKITGKLSRFNFNTAAMTPQGIKVLDEVAVIINGTPGVPVDISGHTCSMGPSDYNLSLGKRRADAARRYLIEKGVRAERLTTISYGETRPIADNETREGRQINRRTEFHVKKGE
ncbi:MAG: OmpA family protein [Deltaproteobacteria bacterium]|nr:OmpA family protein [Deltaproteobacteria bacterium]